VRQHGHVRNIHRLLRRAGIHRSGSHSLPGENRKAFQRSKLRIQRIARVLEIKLEPLEDISRVSRRQAVLLAKDRAEFRTGKDPRLPFDRAPRSLLVATDEKLRDRLRRCRNERLKGRGDRRGLTVGTMPGTLAVLSGPGRTRPQLARERFGVGIKAVGHAVLTNPTVLMCGDAYGMRDGSAVASIGADVGILVTQRRRQAFMMRLCQR